MNYVLPTRICLSVLRKAICYSKLLSCAQAPLLPCGIARWALWQWHAAGQACWVVDGGELECSAEQKWAESLIGEPGICTNAALLKQDLLFFLSCGDFEYIINCHFSFSAACSNTTVTLEVACATLPTLASAAGKLMVYSEPLLSLWSVSHWIFVNCSF